MGPVVTADEDEKLVRLLRLGYRSVRLVGRAAPVVLVASGMGAVVALVLFAINPPELSQRPIRISMGQFLAEIGRIVVTGVAIGAAIGAVWCFTRALLGRSERVRAQVRRFRRAAQVAVSQEKDQAPSAAEMGT